MGFWHTGYMEFHEPVGLDWQFKPRPPSYLCPLCTLEFSSEDTLHKHRLEAHPLRRPALFIDGTELGARRLRIAHALAPSAVRIENCSGATVNGENVRPVRIGDILARVRDDVCRIVLSKDGVDAIFEIEINVASEEDLKGVEQEFRTLVRNRRLDVRAVEEFIAATRPFKSAIGYCDGICSYLYGLLAKERAPDVSLPYEAYSARFSQAGEKLAIYDRPLGRTIGAVIEFHFNHFQDAARLAPGTRVRSVAERYATWLDGAKASSAAIADDARIAAVERMVTDLETEKILQWAMRSYRELAAHAPEIEANLKQELVEFDRVKLQLLLAETYRAAGDNAKALLHARTLRNLAAVEKWAEGLIRSAGEKP
jgi:hypothetical protein